MTDPAPATAPLPLVSRIIGVITSPKATFENIVAAPRPMGVLLVVALVIGIGSVIPQFTEKGRQATLDVQMKAMERFGATVTPEMQAKLEERSHSVPLRLTGVVGGFIWIAMLAMIFTALYWAAFNTVLGGTASFKQVLAIVAHSQVISAISVLAALPITLTTGKMSPTGPFNLGALAPMLEQGSTFATFLSSVSVFTLWGFIVDAIGLGVLYRRNSRNIALVLIAIFLLIMLGMAVAFGRFSQPS